jgi:hypothetical protein
MFFNAVICTVFAFVIAAEKSADSIGVTAGSGRGRPHEPGRGGGREPGRGYPIGSPHYSPSDGYGGDENEILMCVIMTCLCVAVLIGYCLWKGCSASPQQDEEQQALMPDTIDDFKTTR